jgi:cell division protein FtsB
LTHLLYFHLILVHSIASLQIENDSLKTENSTLKSEIAILRDELSLIKGMKNESMSERKKNKSSSR